MNSRLERWYALTFLLDLSHGEINDLLARWESDESRGLASLFDAGAQAWNAAGLSDREQAALEQSLEAHPEAARALDDSRTAGIAVIAPDDERYPAALPASMGRAAPPMLFATGNLELLREPLLAIIGARKATARALDFTRQTAAALARRGVIIVNGYAEGVDRCASRTALEVGGATILIPAQGLLTMTRERADLGGWIDQGRILVLSPYAPRATWDAGRAMSRNAVVSALVRDLIAAQAGSSGGSWDAGRTALAQGKRVWVRHDPSPEHGHQSLTALGAHAVPWPTRHFDEWIDELVRQADEPMPRGENGEIRWTEESALELLRDGSPAQIHDATGLTGRLLIRIVEGRRDTPLHDLKNLQEIRGIGPGALRDVCFAFGLPEPEEEPGQLTLFPEIDQPADGDYPSTQAAPEKSGDLRREQRKREVLRDFFDADESTRTHGPEPAPEPTPHETPFTEITHPDAPPRRDYRNVLLLIIGGLRADGLRITGNTAARTPNIDRMAREGALLERAYAASSCPPATRASILTGLSPRAHGLSAPGRTLAPDVPSLAAHLAREGYHTACVGRFGFEAASGDNSHENADAWQSGALDQWTGPYRGFAQARLVIGHGREALTAGHYARWIEACHPECRDRLLNPPPAAVELDNACLLDVDPSAHPTFWIADHILSFLDDFQEKPFFICAAFPDPHPPYAPLEEYAARFDPGRMPRPTPRPETFDDWPQPLRDALGEAAENGGAAPEAPRRIDPEEARVVRALVCAQMAQVDDAVGRIVEKLREAGLLRDTLIVVTSDGGDFLGDWGFLGAGPCHREPLVRTPSLWRLPDAIAPESRLRAPFSHLDIAPTVCDLINVAPLDTAHGISAAAYLRGAFAAPRQCLVIESPPAPGRPPGPRTLLFADGRKCVLYPGSADGELFDLEKDPRETRNLFAESSTEDRLEWAARLLAWLAETDGFCPAP